MLFTDVIHANELELFAENTNQRFQSLTVQNWYRHSPSKYSRKRWLYKAMSHSNANASQITEFYFEKGIQFTLHYGLYNTVLNTVLLGSVPNPGPFTTFCIDLHRNSASGEGIAFFWDPYQVFKSPKCILSDLRVFADHDYCRHCKMKKEVGSFFSEARIVSKMSLQSFQSWNRM